MTGLKQMSLALATAGVLASGMSQAALVDRGGGLLYDDVLDVTWLQDANYAKTSGYDADGRMGWWPANTWASSLNVSRFAGESLTGWRLASNTPMGNPWDRQGSSYDGSTDQGYNITSPLNELSYMYYVNLGLKGWYSPSGAYQPDFGIFRNGTYGGHADVGLVRNLQSYIYMSGIFDGPEPPSEGNYYGQYSNWHFGAGYGYMYYSLPDVEYYAWAVRPGDVVAVPEPETYALLLAGLVLLGARVKRRRQSFGAS